MTKNVLAVLLIAVILLDSCKNGNSESNDKRESQVASVPNIVLAPVSASPDFPDATLEIKSVKTEKVGKDSTKVIFNFEMKNYELKSQTADNAGKMCNNSDKGQHIHFILDEMPYKALYEPQNEITVSNNDSEHYVLAFLSRSYHESIKSKGAAILYHFKIDGNGNLKILEQPTAPMVFYSRPKGDYVGKDTANVMLDFYVWNCDLSSNGYKVKATVTKNDRTMESSIDKWEPKFIQNIGTGKCMIKLSLVDKDGNQVVGVHTASSRSINLVGEEPLKK